MAHLAYALHAHMWRWHWSSCKEGVYLLGVARSCNCLQRRQDRRYMLLQVQWLLGARHVLPEPEIDFPSATKNRCEVAIRTFEVVNFELIGD